MTNSDAATDPLFESFLVGPHVFPGIWRYMLPREFGLWKFPEETRSSCMNCPKSAVDGFRPDYRCCTYLPRIPNFLLGLSLGTPQGREAVTRIVDQGLATPEGMNGTPQQWYDYLDDLEQEKFGSSDKVLCPMLDQSNGYCRVHAFRNAVCSTFFCLKDHGDRSENFWDAVQTLGSQVEMALTHWVMGELDFAPDDYVKRVDALAAKLDQVSQRDGGWSVAARKKMWGTYFGRELEFYQRCADLVSQHREILWEIAGQSEIYESKEFDRAMIAAVPAELTDQLDPEDLEESGETMPPKDLWKALRKRYDSLWKLPNKTYKLSKKYRIFANIEETAIERRYRGFPHYVRLKKDKDLESHQFLTEAQHELLTRFENPLTIDWRLLAASSSAGETRDFLSKMIGQKILTEVQDCR